MKRTMAAKEARLWTRRSMLLALAGAGLTVPACEFAQLFSWNDGKPTIFGYGTAPNYDKRFKTIRVKIFKDSTFWAALPVAGLEMELTEILVQQIQQKTPYRIDNCDPDTELSGSILSFLKSPVNYNQLNEQRDVQTTMSCEVIWKDLRTGELLSSPGRRSLEAPVPAGLMPGQVDPLNSPNLTPGSMQQMELSAAPISPGSNQATLTQGSPPPTVGNPALGQTNAPGAAGGPPALGVPGGKIHGVLVTSIASYRPEIGQSLATAEQDNCDSMAQQIVSMMERAW